MAFSAICIYFFVEGKTNWNKSINQPIKNRRGNCVTKDFWIFLKDFANFEIDGCGNFWHHGLAITHSKTNSSGQIFWQTSNSDILSKLSCIVSFVLCCCSRFCCWTFLDFVALDLSDVFAETALSLRIWNLFSFCDLVYHIAACRISFWNHPLTFWHFSVNLYVLMKLKNVSFLEFRATLDVFSNWAWLGLFCHYYVFQFYHCFHDLRRTFCFYGGLCSCDLDSSCVFQRSSHISSAFCRGSKTPDFSVKENKDVM